MPKSSGSESAPCSAASPSTAAPASEVAWASAVTPRRPRLSATAPPSSDCAIIEKKRDPAKKRTSAKLRAWRVGWRESFRTDDRR